MQKTHVKELVKKTHRQYSHAAAIGEEFYRENSNNGKSV